MTEPTNILADKVAHFKDDGDLLHSFFFDSSLGDGYYLITHMCTEGEQAPQFKGMRILHLRHLDGSCVYSTADRPGPDSLPSIPPILSELTKLKKA